jgi:hypothetical protein
VKHLRFISDTKLKYENEANGEEDCSKTSVVNLYLYQISKNKWSECFQVFNLCGLSNVDLF